MTNKPIRIAALLRDSRGQSWVETVVMLPVIVALLLGLFYLHDLVTTRIRAIEAARLVAWDSIWYGREDLFERKMLPELLEGAPLVDQALIEKAWKLRLQLVGLGFGLKHVDVFKRKLGKFTDDVGDGVPPTFFVPAALSNAIGDTFGGGDQSTSFITGIADSLSGVLNNLAGLTGGVAFAFQDMMAQNTNWDTEMDNSVYTARVIYSFGYTGFFRGFGTTTIVQRASVLSHPYVLRRTDDPKEYDELLGDACSDVIGTNSGHVVKLWLFPQKPFPSIQGFGSDTSSAIGGITDKVGATTKCIISALGSLASRLDEVMGSNLGFKMPDGTLKEYPELSMPANSGSGSTNGSGASLGGCEPGGGGAMGSGTGFSGCP
jgi:hypothetical protein